MTALDQLPTECRRPVHQELRAGVPLITAIRNEAARVRRDVPLLPAGMARAKELTAAHLENVADCLEPVHPVDGSQPYWTVVRDRGLYRCLEVSPQRATREEAEADLQVVRDRYPEAWVKPCRDCP